MSPEKPININIESDAPLLQEFIPEVMEHLENIERGSLVLESAPDDASTLNMIFRAFHTVKGGAGFLNLVAIGELAHQLESMLDMIRQHKLRIDTNIIDLILKGADTLKNFFTEIDAQVKGLQPVGPITFPTEPLKERVREAISGQSAPAAPPPAAAAPPAQPEPSAPQEPAKAKKAKKPKATKAPEETNTTPATVAPAEPAAPTAPPPSEPAAAPAPTSSEAAQAEPAAPAPAPAAPAAPTDSGEGGQRMDKAQLARAAAAEQSFVKVGTQKLDMLVDLVGELVITQSLIAQSPHLDSDAKQALARNFSHLHRVTKELQRSTMSMRMVPIRATFQKMNRIVRDVAAKQNKRVQLVLEGEGTELDRNIIEEIGDPLVHMIRNAVDHGLESPEEREAIGKPAEGRIVLRAFHQGGSIIIQIQDDGKGLNQERLFAKAVEKGLISSQAHLTEKEIFDLIFLPGFSTASTITDISGRGVGMDVVRQNIEKLRGKIEIESEVGKGSTFTIFMPLTLAIIDGLIVSVGPERYILPTLSVRESLRATSDMLSTVYGRGELLNVRGHFIPLLRLHDLFDVEPEFRRIEDGVLVVVEFGRMTRCILADRLLGKQEIVIKSLGETFQDNRLVAGGAILGNGRVGLILNVANLVQPTAC